MECNLTITYTYERGGHSSISNSSEATNCRIRVTAHEPVEFFFTRADDVEADWPSEMWHLIRALRLQYEAGEKAKATEIKKLLGIGP